MFHKILILLGIVCKKVFAGPLEASIDITNRCGVGCITCWFYSPLRVEKVDSQWARQQMDFDLFKRIIDELSAVGVRRVMVGGSGEPFYHSHIIEMITYAKRAGMSVNSATAGIYFNEKNLRQLYDVGLDNLNISILAGTSETYLKMHPNQKESAYVKIINALHLLSKWKKESDSVSPVINLVYVVCNLNFQEIEKILDLAKEFSVEEVTFKRLATMPFTESLLLREDQLPELDRQMAIADTKARKYGIKTNAEDFRKKVLSGMTDGDYTSQLYSSIPCYIGWIYTRVLSDGTVVPCCGCSDISMGNLSSQSFKKIWYSKEYELFREKSINIRNNNSIIKECACHSCAHAMVNLGIYLKLRPFKKLNKI